MSSKRPWMPWYPGDYIKDTRHLTLIQHGSYILLIGEYWMRGGLPKDEMTVCRLAGMTTEEWQSNRDVFLDLFGPNWTHKRIDAEIAKWDAMSNARKADPWSWRPTRPAIPTSVRKVVITRDGFVCQYCGTENGKFEVDHIHPWSHGGADTPENLTVACKPCNRSKKDKTLAEWRGRK